MDYKGIKIWEEPRRGSVVRVQKLVNAWIIQHVPLEKCDQTRTFGEVFGECIKNDPALMSQYIEFQKEVEDIQPIMMATTLTYSEVQALGDQLSMAEFTELKTICEQALGGGVEDFSEGSGSNTSSKTPSRKKKGNSLKSPAPPGGSMEE